MEPLFSEPQFSEILDLMNKLQLLFFIFHSLSRIDLVNSLDLVNKRGLTTIFTKSSLSCTTHTHRWCWCNYIAPIHSSHYVKGIFSSDHSRVRSGVVGQTHGCARPIFLMVLKRSRSHFFSSNTNSVVKLLVIRL